LPHVCECGGVVRSTPVAQTLVLRRVLTGGISANSGRRFFFGAQYGLLFRERFWNGAGAGTGGLVFGTLLGPEATGPVAGALLGVVVSGTCVSGFLAAPSTRLGSLWWGFVWGVWYGVVV
jgi:hypothetical protein